MAAEAGLAGEANSFAEVLKQFRDRVSPVLIDDSWWNQILECAQGIPAAVATFPFGFEIPLHEQEAKADLGVSVFGLTESAAYYKQQGQVADASSPAAACAELLRQMESDDAPICEIVGRKMMLEYDVASAQNGAQPAPGIFLRPSERPITGDGERVEDISTVLDAIVTGAGWDSDPEELRHLTRVCQAQEGGGTCIGSIGVFPSRKRAIRLLLGSFQNWQDLRDFLTRSGWPGQDTGIASAVKHFEEKGVAMHMGVNLDVTADGPGPRLGVSFSPKMRYADDPNYWVDSPDLWAPFIDCLRGMDLVVPEKLSALAERVSGAEVLHDHSGSVILVWLIHHIKFSVRQGQIDQIKAYPFFMMRSMKRT